MMINLANIIIKLLIISILLISSCQLSFAECLDEIIREKVQETDKDFLDESMSLITYLGDGSIDFFIASILPDEEARSDAKKSLLVGGITVVTLKSIIGQKRPPGPIEYEPFTLDNRYQAMPSGHATMVFALATTIAEHYPKYKKTAYLVATLVGISRLYEDAHWASNVIAGAGLGYLSAKFVEYKW